MKSDKVAREVHRSSNLSSTHANYKFTCFSSTGCNNVPAGSYVTQHPLNPPNCANISAFHSLGFSRSSLLACVLARGALTFIDYKISPESRRCFRRILIVGVITIVRQRVAALSFRVVGRPPYKINATTYVRGPGRAEYNSR